MLTFYSPCGLPQAAVSVITVLTQASMVNSFNSSLVESFSSSSSSSILVFIDSSNDPIESKELIVPITEKERRLAVVEMDRYLLQRITSLVRSGNMALMLEKRGSLGGGERVGGDS